MCGLVSQPEISFRRIVCPPRRESPAAGLTACAYGSILKGTDPGFRVYGYGDGDPAVRGDRRTSPEPYRWSRKPASGPSGRIMGAGMRAEAVRLGARNAVRAADRAEAEAWSLRMDGYGGPPSLRR